MQLHLIDRSPDLDRSKMQFDVLWDDEPSQQDDTVSIITALKIPDSRIRKITRPCVAGMSGNQETRIEDAVKAAVKKLLTQAFIGGFCAGIKAKDKLHTAELIFQATRDAIATPVSDDAITPIIKYYQGDATELVKDLSLMLSHVRIEAYIRSWRINGDIEVGTTQWLMAQDFTPPDGEKISSEKGATDSLAP